MGKVNWPGQPHLARSGGLESLNDLLDALTSHVFRENLLATPTASPCT